MDLVWGVHPKLGSCATYVLLRRPDSRMKIVEQEVLLPKASIAELLDTHALSAFEAASSSVLDEASCRTLRRRWPDGFLLMPIQGVSYTVREDGRVLG